MIFISINTINVSQTIHMTSNFESSSTPFQEDTALYFGWFSEANQQLRVQHQTMHRYNGKILISPPYTYWTRDDKLVLVTEITHSSIPTPRQVKNGDIYLGQLDKYWGRSCTRLNEVKCRVNQLKNE